MATSSESALATLVAQSSTSPDSGDVILEDGDEGIGIQVAETTVTLMECDVRVTNNTSHTVSGDINWDEFEIYTEGSESAVGTDTTPVLWSDAVITLSPGGSVLISDMFNKVFTGIEAAVTKLTAQGQFVIKSGGTKNSDKKKIETAKSGAFRVTEVKATKSTAGGNHYLTVSCKYVTSGSVGTIKIAPAIYLDEVCGGKKAAHTYEEAAEDAPSSTPTQSEQSYTFTKKINVSQAIADKAGRTTPSDGKIFIEVHGVNVNDGGRVARTEIEKAGMTGSPNVDDTLEWVDD